MKPCNKSRYLTALMLAALVAVPSFAQDKKKDDKPAGKPGEADMMAKMMELAKPGEHHKFMENNSVGSWTYTLKA